ncbi:hypothetical protein AVEN_211591-1 [Araneus ventricosus]|uniref:Uncharacterized protein n=1 Tax=Araneus ventricosus TaxID=182803 RepID=A0A4Y2LGY5_ARAVE|nr:hypothetical protein AVEN_211591-1 [Araneus ventricosus]
MLLCLFPHLLVLCLFPTSFQFLVYFIFLSSVSIPQPLCPFPSAPCVHSPSSCSPFPTLSAPVSIPHLFSSCVYSPTFHAPVSIPHLFCYLPVQITSPSYIPESVTTPLLLQSLESVPPSLSVPVSVLKLLHIIECFSKA